MSANEPGVSAIPEQARIIATLENWTRKLLDVSKRNRALSFRPNKVTTITIISEQPAEVFRQLYLRDRQMRFRPAPLKPEAQPEPESIPTANAITETADVLADQSAPEEASEDFGPSLDFAPYSATDLNAQQTDDTLQTSAQPEDLDKSLRRIADQARASIEEQGVNTLFLALGILHYKESATSDDVLRAPLLLLPVELNRKSARTGYTVQATDDDPIVNPALVEYLRRAYGITLPGLPDLAELPENYDLQEFFIDVTQAIEGQAGWQVKTDIYLSFFSFQKFDLRT